jgi:predicted RNA binding protein YcfA (HicA-like mRNA interferase family)
MSERLPALKPKEVLRALKKAGFFVHHQTGSHCILKHPHNPARRVTLAYHNRNLKRKTLASIIEQTGLTDGEFIELL